jgi:hypothetical protein
MQGDHVPSIVGLATLSGKRFEHSTRPVADDVEKLVAHLVIVFSGLCPDGIKAV